MTGTHHARVGRLARLTRRLRPVPGGNPQPPAAPESPWVRAELDRIEAEARAQQPLDSPVHTVADEYGMMPCCGQHETAVPQTDYVTADRHLVTCGEAATATTPSLAETETWGPWDRPDGLFMDERDHYAPPLRPYVPEPYVPDLAADICGLPILRSTIRARARYWHHGCRCEPGNVAGGVRWLASQYADMGPVALSWRAAEPVQSDDTLTWRAAA